MTKFNNVSQSAPGTQPATVVTPVPPRVAEVCDALRSIGISTTQIADQYEANPADARTISERASAVSQQLNSLVTAFSVASQSNEKLREAADKASGLGNVNPTVAVNNSSVRVFGSFDGLLD